MMQPTQPPRRMRYSIESRAKMVGLMVDGLAPQAAAAACGASRATGYRVWRRFQQGGWAALVDRPELLFTLGSALLAAATVSAAIVLRRRVCAPEAPTFEGTS